MDAPSSKRDRDDSQMLEHSDGKRSAGEALPAAEQPVAKRSKTEGGADEDREQKAAPTQNVHSEVVESAEETSTVDHDMSDAQQHRRNSNEGSGSRDREWYNDENTVFVKGLPHETTEAHLTEFFKSCGTILGVRLGRNPEGQLRGFGYVQFASEADMQEATTLNKKKLLGKQLFVAQSAPPRKGVRATPAAGAPSDNARRPGQGGRPSKDAPAKAKAPVQLLGMPRSVAVRTVAARKPDCAGQAPTPQGGAQ